jgi:8-oxo-dGTP diphosphatase
MSVPQFGSREPGRDYPDRPAAFAVVAQDGKIACVRVDLGAGRSRLDLPGGGLDPGESAADAGRRECAEEAGLQVRMDGEAFVRADHYFINTEGRANNTRGAFFRAELERIVPDLQVEPDHALVWMTPEAALRALDRDSHAWALAVWLRGRVEA